MISDDPINLTPDQFESEVEKLVRKLGYELAEFKTQRLEQIKGSDGEYEIDVTARFEALGVNFLVLIECKHHKHPIKRDVVQVLYDRLRAVGAQKGMIFATTSFQRGAIEYAKKHGIALVEVVDGKTSYSTRAYGTPPTRPPWVPQYVGWLVTLSDEGHVSHSLITEDNPQSITEIF
jgi:restriction system protein